MLDEMPRVTSCPLCLAPDEVTSMVTVQIERAIPKGRFAVMICRNCTVAVLEAAAQVEPPLLSTLLADTTRPSHAPAEQPGSVDIEEIFGDPPADETQAESAQLHDGEES